MNNTLEVLTQSQYLQLYWIACFSEFVGTAVLILLGNGVGAATSYKRMYANQPGKWVVIILGWAFAVFVGATVSSVMGGLGHLNPAVTIMDVIKTSHEATPTSGIYYWGMMGNGVNLSSILAITFFAFLFFQITGAIFGQSVLNFLNYKFLKDKENDLLTIRSCHCTGPAFENRKDKATIFNFSYEFIGTAVLLGLILAFGHKNAAIGSGAGSLATIPVTFIIMSIGLSLGSATGYAINPVRDAGPRIVFSLLLSKIRKDDWNKSYINTEYMWVPIIAPMLAGVAIGLLSFIPNLSNLIV